MGYTVISTFAGCGGSSLGYKLAGFKELLAIEWDDNAVATFKANFPEVNIWQQDIKAVTGKSILDFCKLKKGDLDIFDGSPPCQGFSTCGKRQVNDNRNDLFKEFVRLVDELQPKVFVMENVSGLVKGKMKGRFIEIIIALKSLNYNVKCKLLNAMYYEVPQSRQRLIFIGVRKDLNLDPVYPKTKHEIITVGEALKNVKNKTYYVNFNPRKLQLRDRLLVNKIAPTLIKTAGSIKSKCVIHFLEDRHLTIEEAKRICSFPDEFKLFGKFQEQWARLGNCVPPKFMYHIAKTIKNEILDKLI